MLSSFYIGATGMKSQAEGMQVLGNNIANVSTLGFKASKTLFANLMSETLTTGANSAKVGSAQKGLGVQVHDVKVDWSQGSHETTNTLSDLSISGNGFFGVQKDGELRYTRAGNFRVNKQGYMVDPNGYRLQGTSLYGSSKGTTGDIRFEPDSSGSVKLPAKATTRLTAYNNLGSGDNSTSESNPYFAMFEQWNANNDPPLGSSQYAYSTSMTVYDEKGEKHTVTIYFDEVKASGSGSSTWEFVVAMDPSSDGRSGFKGTSSAGLLMAGTMSFNSSGQLTSMSAFTNNGSGGKDLNNWVRSGFDADGYPKFDVTFDNGATASMGIDLGFRSTGSGWSGSAENASQVGSSAGNLPSFSGERGSTATTNYGGSSSTLRQTQNGYGEGFLQSFTVDAQGVIKGTFSNGQNQELYQVNLYNFTNTWGLKAEGNNHYSATPAAGDVTQGVAGEGAFGSISQYALEQSNVDLAREFVDMITTQRAFQANSKIISTSDSILQNALSMKR